MSDHTTTMPDTAIIAGMVEIERLRRKNARLREVLEDISAEGRHARSGSTAYRMAVIARKALQEDSDE